MGGHQSTQTVDVSTNVVANIVQTTTQNCISSSSGVNELDISGSRNRVSDITQNMSLSVNQDCSTLATQNSTFTADLQNSIQQAMKDKQVSMTQWMDPSRDTQSTRINQLITTSVTQNLVQNCVSKLNGQNLIRITGNENTISDITQNMTLSAISKCLLQNGQTSKAIADITNTSNQHSTYESESFFAFIGDALKGIFASTFGVLAIAFIVIIIFALMLKFLFSSGSGSSGGGYEHNYSSSIF